MKLGDEIEFYLFSESVVGIITQINKPTPAKGNTPAKDQTVNIKYGGINYPEVKTVKILPKKKKEIPPWYILKNKK